MTLSESEIASAFDAAAQTEPGERHLAEVYRTGVMYSVNNEPVMLNDTSLGLTEGRILWYLSRQFRPPVIIETGFGRGGSAAFFLTALSAWKGRLISIDPAFRSWAQDTGATYIDNLGFSGNHTLIEEPSELALANIISQKLVENLKLSYIDGSHHFDGTLIDFIYLDRLTEIGGIIAIDDAHAPAVRTLASYIAHNLPYQLHYATSRLVLCKKLAHLDREWCHFKPFQSSPKTDWDVHDARPDATAVPGATFGSL
jgi:predicted O-methyltransferase YrrM